MEKITAFLNKKVAGIPMYVIGLVVAVIALWGAWRLSPSEDEEPIPEEPASDDEGFDASMDGQQPIFLASTPQPPDALLNTQQPEPTNDEWGQRAISVLTADGVPYQDAASAIQKFLNGETLSNVEGRNRDRAIAVVGTPPEPVIPGRVNPYKGPAARQGNPPTIHTVKGTSDNQDAELARLYYGMATPDAMRLLRSENTTIKPPYPIGTRVNIPRFHRPQYFKTTHAVRGLYQIAGKNATTPAKILALNPGRKADDFPLKAGVRVRVA